VAAGAIAEKWLSEAYGIEIVAWVSAVGKEVEHGVDLETITREEARAAPLPPPPPLRRPLHLLAQPRLRLCRWTQMCPSVVGRRLLWTASLL
jgi:hypothetical protein